MKSLPIILVLLACGCRPQSVGVSPDGDTKNPEISVFLPVDVPSLDDLDGNSLQAIDPKAKTSVLVFVLSDCPIANSYIPTLNRLYESYKSRGVQMIVVEADPKITLGEARKHAEEFQIGLPVVVDSGHRWVKFAMAKRTPEAVVFSPRGEILYRGRIDDQYVGFGKRRMEVTTHELNDALEAVLNDRPVPNPVTEAIGCYIPDLTREGK